MGRDDAFEIFFRDENVRKIVENFSPKKITNRFIVAVGERTSFDDMNEHKKRIVDSIGIGTVQSVFSDPKIFKVVPFGNLDVFIIPPLGNIEMNEVRQFYDMIEPYVEKCSDTFVHVEFGSEDCEHPIIVVNSSLNSSLDLNVGLSVTQFSLLEKSDDAFSHRSPISKDHGFLSIGYGSSVIFYSMSTGLDMAQLNLFESIREFASKRESVRSPDETGCDMVAVSFRDGFVVNYYGDVVSFDNHVPRL